MVLVSGNWGSNARTSAAGFSAAAVVTDGSSSCVSQRTMATNATSTVVQVGKVGKVP